MKIGTAFATVDATARDQPVGRLGVQRGIEGHDLQVGTPRLGRRLVQGGECGAGVRVDIGRQADHEQRAQRWAALGHGHRLAPEVAVGQRRQRHQRGGFGGVDDAGNVLDVQHGIDRAGDAGRLRTQLGVVRLRQVRQQQRHRLPGRDAGAVEGVGGARHLLLQGAIVDGALWRVRRAAEHEA